MQAYEFLDYFRSNQDNALNSIREIVEIESPSRDIAGSRAVVDFLEKEFFKISSDFKIEKVFSENLGEHLIIRSFQSSEKPILILGHTDTVHPRKTKEQNPTRIEDDKFYGCGIFDMKANIIIVLEVLKAFTKFNVKPPRPLTILLSCDEEIGSPTGRELVEREAKRAEFCLVCEPSANGKVKTGRKGTGMFHLKTHGVPAHAGLEPEKGASAILEISRQIPKIHELNDLANGTTANVCTISGGTTSNVIPEYANCEIDVRFTSIGEAERIENKIRNLKSTDDRVKIEIEGAINRPPMERTENVIKLYKKAKNL
ncbi:MAG: M20 family metallopeptidase, partial [Acidobacteriota bacterium]